MQIFVYLFLRNLWGKKLKQEIPYMRRMSHCSLLQVQQHPQQEQLQPQPLHPATVALQVTQEVMHAPDGLVQARIFLQSSWLL
jgi:hypothetical protein